MRAQCFHGQRAPRRVSKHKANPPLVSNTTYLLVPAAHVLRPDFAPLLRSPESVGGARKPPPRGHSSAICVNTRELRVVIARVFNEIISREPTREIGVEVDLGMRTPLLQIGL
jgi:hypothetical protein